MNKKKCHEQSTDTVKNSSAALLCCRARLPGRQQKTPMMHNPPPQSSHHSKEREPEGAQRRKLREVCGIKVLGGARRGKNPPEGQVTLAATFQIAPSSGNLSNLPHSRTAFKKIKMLTRPQEGRNCYSSFTDDLDSQRLSNSCRSYLERLGLLQESPRAESWFLSLP